MVVSGPVTVCVQAGQYVNNGTYVDSTGTLLARGGVDFNGTGTNRLHNLTFQSGTDTSNINSLMSVYNRTYLRSGTLYANNLLYVRSDDNLIADMRVDSKLYNPVQGLVTRATVTSGSGCSPYSSNLTLNIFGPAMLFQWQSSPDGTTWSNIAGATAGTYTASVASTTHYRCSLSTNNSTFTQATPAVELVHTGGLPAITGTASTCTGTTTPLSIAYTGGTWSSSTPSIASVDATTGMVTGINAGTTTITYTASTSCTQTIVFTVNPLPASITGNASICKTSTSLLSSATPGGTWSSSDPLIASTPSTSGLIYGESLGTATITYTLPTGCYTTTEVTVNPSITSAITGTLSVCHGLNTTLSIAETGGTWSSSIPTRASVNPSTGVVLGISLGTAIISYSTTAYCYQTAIVTVNPLPKIIAGTAVVCSGSTSLLSNATPGGTWSSSNMSVATVPSTPGLVTGVAAGTTTISYILPTGCFATRIVTVNPGPTPITGSLLSCIGRTIIHSSTPSGGTWSSSTPARLTINTSGFSTGVAIGTATISYTISSGCRTTAVVSVGALPTVTGPTLVCAGNSITLSGAPLGGTWVSSNPSGASVNPVGIVTGVATGVTTIRYISANTCFRNTNVTVNAIVKPINGTLAICTGTTTTLTSGTAGGTWQSSNTGVAAINVSSGVVNAITAGTTTITYRTGATCFATRVLTVNPTSTVAVISGPSIVCTGNNITLTNTATGGVWSSSNTSVATIGSTGILSAIAAGTTIVSYTKTSICGSAVATKVITVNPLPNAGSISGTSPLCRTTSATFTSTAPSGTWSSNYTAGASVNASSGLVTGLANGSFIISYRMTNSCGTAYASFPVTVISAPSLAAISGATSVCAAATTTLTNTTTGGTWSSTNTGVATINPATGAVTGIAAGTTTISYNVTNICGSAGVARLQTVNPLPLAGVISGTATLSAGSTTSLTATPSGGTWLSASGSIASVNAITGVVTGVSSGVATISYTRTNSCGSASSTIAVTVNPATTPITGTRVVCVGATTTLANATPGGTWSTADGSIATVGITGIVSGVSTGTTTITYSFSSGGNVTATVTVNTLPIAYTGPGIICSGSQLNLGSSISGCTWTSGNSSRAIVAYTTGIVTGGTTLGTVNISYTNLAGCSSIAQLTVNPAVAVITGVSSPCLGSSITLANATSGGTWSSSNTANATIDVSSGVLTAVGGGTSTISYTISLGCIRTAIVTVGTPPSITGSSIVCLGQTSYLSSSGGVWSGSSNPSVATVTGGGFVSGLAEGTATITYRSSANPLCFVTTEVTVNPLPSVIAAPPVLCPSHTATLTSAPLGGTWTSNNPAVVSVDPSTGVITANAINHTGISLTVINYTSTLGCTRSVTATVSPVPAPIYGGTLNLCIGGSSTLLTGTTGGTWSSTSASVASISASGFLSGISSGTSLISYSNASGCAAVAMATVNAAPGSNTGIATVCMGATTTLSNSSGTGTWSSSNISRATVGATTGVVTGVNAGTVIITYQIAAGCFSTTVVTVNASLPAITGASSLCVLTNTILSNTTPDGTWSSSDPSVASIGATGNVFGTGMGTATISYTVGSCTTTRSISVNCFARPAAPDVSDVAQTSFSLSPNPTTGNLTLATSVAGTATMYTLDGKEVQQYDVQAGNNNLTLPYNLASGVYMCRFIGNDGSSQMARLVLNN